MNKMTFSEVMQSAEIITSVNRSEDNQAPNGRRGPAVQPGGMRIVASRNRYAYRMKFALLLSLFTSALLAPIPLCSRKATTQGIQAAIDACSTRGGGIAYVPPGQYTIGPLWLKDNVELRLEPAPLFHSAKIRPIGPRAARPSLTPAGRRTSPSPGAARSMATHDMNTPRCAVWILKLRRRSSTPERPASK